MRVRYWAGMLCAALLGTGCSGGPARPIAPATATVAAARRQTAPTPDRGEAQARAHPPAATSTSEVPTACADALARAGVHDSGFTLEGRTSYAVPAGPTPPQQGVFTLAVRNALSAAVGLPFDGLAGQQVSLIDIRSAKTDAARAAVGRSPDPVRTPQVLGYECALGKRAAVVGLWGLADPTIEPEGLVAADGRTLAQVEGATSTFSALVQATGYNAAGDARLPADATPLEALLRALGRLNVGVPGGPLAPAGFSYLKHLVPLRVVGGRAFPDGGVVLEMDLWPDYAKPFRTSDLAGNGTTYLEWSMRPASPTGAWTLADLGTGGSCSPRSATDQAGPLPPADLVTPYTATVGAAAASAVTAYYADLQHGDCQDAFAMLAGQMLHDAGSPAAICAQRYTEGPPVVTGVLLRSPVSATAGLRFPRHLVDADLVRQDGTWKVAMTRMAGAGG